MQIFDVREAADYLRISPSTLREYVRRGMVKFVKLSTRLLFRMEDLDSFVAEHVNCNKAQVEKGGDS